jgi:uncharacterized protein (TIGR02246 family)
MTAIPDLEQRLTRLEATEELRTLAHEYCHGLDKRDLERFLSVWDDDGQWVLADDVRPRGHSEIEKMLTEGIWSSFAETHHWTSNHVVDWSEQDPRGTCDVHANVRDNAGQWLRASATYIDSYVNVDGRWRISRREATVHFTEPLG